MMAFFFLALLGSALLCFYFSLTQVGILSFSREKLEEWKKAGRKLANALEPLFENRKRFLNFLDILQILVSFFYFYFLTLGAVFGFSFFENTTNERAAFLTLGILFYILFLHFFPEKLAENHPEKITQLLGASLAFLYKLFGWSGALVSHIADTLASFLGHEPQAKHLTLSGEEIEMLVRLGKEEPLEIEKEEKEMIESVVTFGKTLVKEIMTPRIDMVCVEANKTISEVLDVAMQHGYSKFPVYEGTIDNIVGITYVKDLFRLFRNGQQETRVKEVVRKPFFVPESKKVDDLLRDMQREKISMAIVVDEYGGTDGLVTIEDLVEEIVGEIADEHDKTSPPIFHISENTWLVDGRINIEDLNAKLGLNIPHEEFETLGGYVYGLMGKVPKAGDKLETESLILEVTEVHRQRIAKVKLTPKASVSPNQEGFQ
jgi:putative hemolysin